MAKKEVVYQANPLIEGRREFDVMETRLFYLGLKGVVPKLTNKDTVWTAREGFSDEFPMTIIPTNELIGLFGSDKYYSTLEDICDKLAKKTVKAKTIDKDGNKSFSVYPVFAELHYDSKAGLKIEFNSKMKPWLLDLADKPFTKLPFEQVWQLSFQRKEPYAVRLFELLLQYQNTKTKERVLTIEELKQCLGVAEEAYEGRIDRFKDKVIEANVKAINKATAYKIEYESVKEGRKIVAFKFKIHVPAELAKAKRKEQISQIGSITKGHHRGMESVGSIMENIANIIPDSNKNKAEGITESKVVLKEVPKFEPNENELNDIEIELLMQPNCDLSSPVYATIKAKMERLGLSLNDIKAGKKK